MDNNTSEAFNEAIKDARDKPMLTMLESIRRYLMTRLQTRFKLVMGFKGTICPRIRSKLEGTKKWVGECEVMYSGGTIFEVITVLRTYIVDIGQKTCSCRKWDVSGVPCVHGLAAIIIDKSDPKQVELLEEEVHKVGEVEVEEEERGVVEEKGVADLGVEEQGVQTPMIWVAEEEVEEEGLRTLVSLLAINKLQTPMSWVEEEELLPMGEIHNQLWGKAKHQ
ncbi:hypothetical protein Vadar_011833 [Vaccinium darrowii]|uniref:Uncharacterized protein n=1 Tax=Vaccinium darrowii TaxID=229202 RepID=A0ACB7Y6C8_9ERIC|nr:hypothetical protein Vadar_011833 [Vaccinium darrowii]